jgi:undecaprenyl diphosphate synthase
MGETQNTPACIGIVIDGNRRWAKAHGGAPYEGHREGAARLKEFARWAYDAGVRYVISYTFSTENWNRTTEEVEHLMNLLRQFLKDNLKEMIKEKVRVRFIGQRKRFAQDIQKLFDEVEEKTKDFVKGTLIFALSYGGRAELLDAVKQVADSKSAADIGQMTEDDFSEYLWTKDIPDPDMIIRTGGEKRLSNFLPWQSVYSELFFTDTLWPAFTKEEFLQMLDEFAHRERRRGK